MTGLCIGFLLLLQAPAQAAPLTLDEAVRTAIEHHPALEQSRQLIAAAQARIKEARSAFYPQITASGFAKQGLSGASNALGLRGLVTSPLFRDIGSSAAILQNVFDFGRTSHEVDADRLLSESLRYALAAQQADVVFGVERAYYKALRQQRLLGVAETITSQKQLTVRQANAFFRAQLKSRVDVTLAEVGASQAALELAKARQLMQTTFAELNAAMGVGGEPVYSLTDVNAVVESPAPVEQLVGEALRNRPELMALDAQIRAGEAFVARSRSNMRPRFSFLWSGGWVRFSEYSLSRLMLGAVGIDFPIFTGGRLKGELEEAEANLAAARAARDELIQKIRLDIYRAHEALQTAGDSVRAAEQVITQARTGLRLAQVRYGNQLGSFVELSSAEVASAQAEASFAEAGYSYKEAEADLRHATGRMFNPAP